MRQFSSADPEEEEPGVDEDEKRIPAQYPGVVLFPKKLIEEVENPLETNVPST